MLSWISTYSRKMFVCEYWIILNDFGLYEMKYWWEGRKDLVVIGETVHILLNFNQHNLKEKSLRNKVGAQPGFSCQSTGETTPIRRKIIHGRCSPIFLQIKFPFERIMCRDTVTYHVLHRVLVIWRAINNNNMSCLHLLVQQRLQIVGRHRRPSIPAWNQLM